METNEFKITPEFIFACKAEHSNLHEKIKKYIEFNFLSERKGIFKKQFIRMENLQLTFQFPIEDLPKIGKYEIWQFVISISEYYQSYILINKDVPSKQILLKEMSIDDLIVICEWLESKISNNKENAERL
jgi:hypothetical protein